MRASRGMGAIKKCYAEGGSVSLADRIRKLVGMPEKQRAKQLDQQEKDILSEKKASSPPPPADSENPAGIKFAAGGMVRRGYGAARGGKR